MALVYFDTSVIFSLHILDTNTEKLTEISSKLRGGFAISAWTRTEIASALGIMVRRKDLSAMDAHAAFEDMQAFCNKAQNLPVTAAAYDLATRWMQDFDLGLRASDALHGAICKLNKAQLFTADHGLVKAMQHLGQKPLVCS
jgi:uncharacterized protein